ncbi:hypothetical protein [uncultured Bartonella sp.]|nr:hypothetical protein [uncultured Bartonella sp.]
MISDSKDYRPGMVRIFVLHQQELAKIILPTTPSCFFSEPVNIT